MERHIFREGTSSCPISSSWSQGVKTVGLPCKPYSQRRPDASDRLRIPGLTLDSDLTASLNLAAWFSYHVVSFRLHTRSAGLPRRTAIPLFTNHNVTACQSTRGHQERAQNPCQQSLYNTCPVVNLELSLNVSITFYTLPVTFFCINHFKVDD